jgi:hypothetical protein
MKKINLNLKKNKKIMKLLQLLLITLLLTFTSCKRNEILAEEEETTSQQQLQSDDIEDEVNIISDASMLGGPNFRTSDVDGILGSCATITKDTIGIKHYLITVDFGTVNCQSVWGKNRRGKIIIDLVGNYKDSGSVKTITFDNFYRNDNRIEGTRIIKNTGRNYQKQNTWSVQAVDMKMTKTDGKFFTWNSTRTRTILSGDLTSTISDDKYQITGVSFGENSEGVNFTATIVEPLIRVMSCGWITSGIIEFENSKGTKRTINYGWGECEANAVIQVTGKRGRTYTKTITLN